MTWRIKFLNLLFLLWSFLVVFRLIQWQIIQHEKFSVLADSQHYGSFEIPAKRGEIRANDSFPLVSNQTVYLIYAQTLEIKDAAKKQNKSFEVVSSDIAKSLAPFFVQMDNDSSITSPDGSEAEQLKAKVEEIKDKLGQNGAVWVPLRHKVPNVLVEQIKNLKLPGFGYEEESARLYPEASLAAHLLGFVGSDANGQDKGYFGLEGYYDAELKGRSGFLKEEIDASGRPILVGDRTGVDSIDGSNITTTIDRGVQYIVDGELEKGVKRFGAKSGSAIVMDPKTGGIIALANYPKYDPSRWRGYPQNLFKNPSVADNYEPGSTFKLITFAAGLNEGEITADSTCVCDGPKKVDGFEIRTWNNKYYPNSTMVEVLEHSDNVGAAEVSDKLGIDRMSKYIENFGFGQKSGIDLEEESPGIIRNKKDWHHIDLNTASFGQGISVTALQVVRAVSAIANGGKLMKPYLVKEIQDDSRTVEIKPQVVRQVIKDATSKVLTEIMVKAVENGEAKRLVPKGYRVAGKTGTAQIPIEGHYDPTKTVASFVGFAPVNDPKYVMLVKYDQPSTSIYGAETAAPTFFDITKELFTYWGIPPN